MSKRVAFYVRYSSVLQDITSIEDQIRICEAYAKSQGWTVFEIYSDKELSAQSAARPDYQRMLRDSKARKFDIVLAESIDRLCRRTADITDLRDQLAYRGQSIYTVSIGEITQIHAAILGVIAEQFSKDVAQKTRRGQDGSTRRGRVAAGMAYGYDVSHGTHHNRVINPKKAEIVRRIFEEFANGVAPAKIAAGLNADDIPGPSGGLWQSSTIRGHAKRQSGILRNRAYIGQIIYGQMQFRKNPTTGRRTSIPGKEPLSIKSPTLRIIPQELWETVTQRLHSISREMAIDPESGLALNRAHRKHFLLSGLLKCGSCGGNIAILGKDRYGCSTRKRKGTCDNAKTITRNKIEGRVLASLKQKLLAPDHLQAFVSHVTKELATQQKTTGSRRKSIERDLTTLNTKIARILDQIEDGVAHAPLLLERLQQRQAEHAFCTSELASLDAEAQDPFVMPDFPATYGRLVCGLEDTLRDPNVVQRAHEALAELIEAIELHPNSEAQDGYAITLIGDCAGILGAYAGVPKEKLPGAVTRAESQFSVVAGVGFEPTTFRL